MNNQISYIQRKDDEEQIRAIKECQERQQIRRQCRIQAKEALKSAAADFKSSAQWLLISFKR